MSLGISSRCTAATWTGLVAALGFVFVAAAPVRADDYFSAGFEDELGRIAARATVGVGVNLLLHATAPPYVEHRVVHYRAKPHHGPRHRHFRRGHRGHLRGHGFYGHRHRRAGHWRGIPPCEVERRVIIERRSRRAWRY